jgi:hypothetical protein
MNIQILGSDHEIQKVDAWRSDEMKAAYCELLTTLINERCVQAICEEADTVYE